MNHKEKLERLICESINDECACYCNLSSPSKCFQCECIADHLIANNVIVLPAKIGDDIWWIDEENKAVRCENGDVAGFYINKSGIHILDRFGCTDPIGSTYCFLSKEEAEAELKRRLNRRVGLDPFEEPQPIKED